MKRKRIKKYQAGGSTAFTAGAGFSGTGLGSGIGAFGGMAGGLIEGADMKDGYMSTGGALGSGALKGASMGAAFGPAGMLIGGALGAAGGLMKRDQVNAAEDARLKAERDEERLRANMENQMKHQQMNQVLDQFPVKGSGTPRFALGGTTIGPGYEVEGGEMMQTKGETPQTYGQGGVSQVASQEYEVKGPKHSNGGVQANDNQGARVYSDKLTVDNPLLSKLSKL